MSISQLHEIVTNLYVGETEIQHGSLQRVGYYVANERCIDYIQDIQTFLKRDRLDPEKSIFKTLTSWKIVSKDLIPILLRYREPKFRSQSMEICRLLVMMTKLPDPICEDYPNLIESLQNIKIHFLESSGDCVAALMTLIVPAMERKGCDRTEEDNEEIEILLQLIRNLLKIPDKKLTSFGFEEPKTRLQDDFIQALSQAHFFDLLMVMARSIRKEENNSWSFLILEIIYLLLKKDRPEKLVKNVPNVSRNADGSSNREKGLLKNLLDKERKRKMIVHQPSSSSPTRTQIKGTTFVMKTSERTVVKDSLNKLNECAPITKVQRNTRKKLQKETKEEQGSLLQVQMILKNFLDDFLDSGSYIKFMSFLKEQLSEDRSVEVDEKKALYIWLLDYVNTFVYANFEHAKSKNSDANINAMPISPFIQFPDFEFLGENLPLYRDEKDWIRVQILVSSIKSMLLVIQGMSQSSDTDLKSISSKIQNNIFYYSKFMECISSLLRDYKPSQHSESFGQDLLEIVQTLQELMDDYQKIRPIFQGKKKRVHHSTSKKKRKSENEKENEKPNEGNIDNSEKEKTTEDVLGEIANGNSNDQNVEEETFYSEDEDEDEDEDVVDHMTTSMENFVKYFIHPKIVATYASLLENWKRNPDIAHIVALYFERVYAKTDYGCMLYQFSVFRLFTSIYADPVSKSEQYLKLSEVLRNIKAGFMDALDQNPYWSYMIIPWKTKSECSLLNSATEYGGIVKKKKKKSKKPKKSVTFVEPDAQEEKENEGNKRSRSENDSDEDLADVFSLSDSNSQDMSVDNDEQIEQESGSLNEDDDFEEMNRQKLNPKKKRKIIKNSTMEEETAQLDDLLSD